MERRAQSETVDQIAARLARKVFAVSPAPEASLRAATMLTPSKEVTSTQGDEII